MRFALSAIVSSSWLGRTVEPLWGVMVSVAMWQKSFIGVWGHSMLCANASASLLTDQPAPSMCRFWTANVWSTSESSGNLVLPFM